MDVLLNKLALVVTFVLQLFVLRLLIKQRLQKRFFFFLVYLIYELCESVLRLAVAGNKAWYYNVYYWTEIGDVSLAVLTVRESFLNVFQGYTRLRWFVWTVWGCVGLAILYSILKAWILPPVQANRRGLVIIAVEGTVDYSLTSAGLLYFALILFFGIKEHQWETGIISGFTIITGVAVFGLLVRSYFGPNRTPSQWIPALAYILGEIEWARVLRRPERKVPTPIHNLTIDDLSKLNEYSRGLRRLFGRKP